MTANGTMASNSTLGDYGNTTSISGNETGPNAGVPTFPGLDLVSYFAIHVHSKQVARVFSFLVTWEHVLILQHQWLYSLGSSMTTVGDQNLLSCHTKLTLFHQF